MYSSREGRTETTIAGHGITTNEVYVIFSRKPDASYQLHNVSFKKRVDGASEIFMEARNSSTGNL